MRAALVEQPGAVPVYATFRDPFATPGKSVIRVTASSLSHVTRSRASGKHYSARSAVPFVPGVDGVGTTADGNRVYFLMPEVPFGGFGDATLVDDRRWFTLPDDLDDATAAAMAIPGMSSWAALVERTHLRAGETVLVHGATGISGRLAIQVAKHLGAGKVIATGRDARALADLTRIGADAVIPLVPDRAALEAAFAEQFAKGVDHVLDYLWGSTAETLIVAAAKAGPEGVAIRYAQIGSIAGDDITLPSAALRSSSLQLMGSGLNSVPFERLLAAIRGVLQAAPHAGFEAPAHVLPLSDIASAWNHEGDGRVVLRP